MTVVVGRLRVPFVCCKNGTRSVPTTNYSPLELFFMTESTSGADLLNNLAHEFAERFRRGERPALTEYTDKYPELASDIRELFPALVAMEQLGEGEPAGAGGVSPLTRRSRPRRRFDQWFRHRHG